MHNSRPFLTAEWRHLVMLNFEVPRECLAPLVPLGTEIDEFEGRCLVSIVAFEFAEARVFGVKIPGHQLFPEVNLRFYVRRWTGTEWRRGVVFIKELVPRRMVAFVARHSFGQNFEYAPMQHRVERDAAGVPSHVQYEWTYRGHECYLSTDIGGLADEPEQLFVAEHYYAYANEHGELAEYHVAHPLWRLFSLRNLRFELNAESVYGDAIGLRLNDPASSAVYADGSRVAVVQPISIRNEWIGSEQDVLGACVNFRGDLRVAGSGKTGL
jgi:uncharacterized protein